jgi:hypothetical protein
MHPFRAAVEAKDLDVLPALLAENVVFMSPVAFKPYQGRELVAAILRGAARTFKDFRYEREIVDPNGRDLALIFAARVGERDIEGCDFLQLAPNDLIERFTVMVRPLSAAQVLAEEMALQFERIQNEVQLTS